MTKTQSLLTRHQLLDLAALQGWLEPYDGDTFRTRFPDKREEDAFVTFSILTAKPATATVKGVSPDIDFSYDYQDLKLSRA